MDKTGRPQGGSEITVLLEESRTGNRDSLDELLPLVYAELRRVAQKQLSSERSCHTLQATALVHEAYIRLLEQKSVDWQNRLHFFSIAAEMMRRILVNHAVKRNVQKRGAGVTMVSLDEGLADAQDDVLDVVILDDSLRELAKFDETQARLVELRFFGGLTIQETAEVLEISESTVKREWRIAKAWLRSRIG